MAWCDVTFRTFSELFIVVLVNLLVETITIFTLRFISNELKLFLFFNNHCIGVVLMGK